jgi:4,5:9,10-diseco-3-hydroxy-5,9,17-trioxoandrosta-1(10),2-diene-4-oate hydrolase
MKARAVNSLEGEYVTINGITVRYIARGAGLPVLLIHGFDEFLEVWSLNIDALSKHHRVYAIDLPGHGLSQKPKADYKLSFFTEFVINFMSALGLEPATLVGHSMGGALSLEAAINYPERIAKLILVDSGGFSREAPLLYRLATLPVVGDVIIRPTTKPLLRRGLRGIFYNPDIVTEEMVELDYHYLKMPGAKETMLNVIRNNSDLSGPRPEVVLLGRLHLVRVPTLLIHGAQDRLVPLKQVKAASKLIPNARLKVFDRCGHCPQIEKAIAFNKTVSAFLKPEKPQTKNEVP